MTDVVRAKYMTLMSEVEELEERVDELTAGDATPEQVMAVEEELASKRHELQRLSDGCGPGRSQ
ncbi:hypothetical protein BVY04_01895 [bacterium M21]|nr:hypothetical protein BVY04_01895 [bacterium M21]